MNKFRITVPVLCLSLAFLTGCSNSFRPPSIHSSSTFAIKSITGNKVSPLVNAEEVYPAIERVIDSAKKSVQLEVYLFGGAVGKRMADRLIAKKQAGLSVQVVVDPKLGISGPSKQQMPEIVEYLEGKGIEVKRFPVDRLPKGPTWLSRGSIDHAKLVVADGARAVIGGMNFYDDAAKAHDFMLEVEGPAAGRLASMVQEDYLASGGKKPISFSPPPIAGKAMIEIGDNGIAVQGIEAVLIEAINKAKRRLWVEMLLLDHNPILQAMIEAKRRGVDVRVIVDKTAAKEALGSTLKKLPLEGVSNISSVARLFDEGVPVRWYRPSERFTYLHAKLAVVDDQVMVGSVNYTYKALGINREVVARTDDPQTLERFASAFASDWQSQSEEITGISHLQRAIAALMDKIKQFSYQIEERTDGNPSISTENVLVPDFNPN